MPEPHDNPAPQTDIQPARLPLDDHSREKFYTTRADLRETIQWFDRYAELQDFLGEHPEITVEHSSDYSERVGELRLPNGIAGPNSDLHRILSVGAGITRELEDQLTPEQREALRIYSRAKEIERARTILARYGANKYSLR